jgi:hypothetical protein
VVAAEAVLHAIADQVDVLAVDIQVDEMVNQIAVVKGAPRGRGEGRFDSRSEGGRGRSATPAYFEPTIKVDLYPQDEAFEALINRLRSSARTYQLFDIAHLLLEKPDRYIVVVSPKPVKGNEPAPLYYSVPGHLPFETEEDAINHVMANYLDQFFEIEEIEVEPPKGNFQMVNRCTITSELLGPPNYHRYQEFLQLHYAARITGMSFEQFTARVESSKEQEHIDAWLESMKKGARYTVKDHQEGEPESLETLEAVATFSSSIARIRSSAPARAVRFAGRDIERLPKGRHSPLCRSLRRESKALPARFGQQHSWPPAPTQVCCLQKGFKGRLFRLRGKA